MVRDIVLAAIGLLAAVAAALVALRLERLQVVTPPPTSERDWFADQLKRQADEAAIAEADVSLEASVAAWERGFAVWMDDEGEDDTPAGEMVIDV